MRRALLLAGIFLSSVAPSRGDEPSPPESQPRWFKGNLHTHSLWSDGNDFPEMIVDWYARRDYQFLALSDHNTLGQGQRWIAIADVDKKAKAGGFARYKSRFGDDWVETQTREEIEQVRLKPIGEFRTLFESSGKFLLIQGEEITDRFDTKPIHMNATNLAELIKPQSGKNVTEVMANNLAAVEEQAKRLGRPILGHLNHPNFGYAITAEELAMVAKEKFFEVYNGHPGVHHLGDSTHVGIERMWDIINTLRIAEMKLAPLYGLGTDDSHDYHGHKGSSQPGRGWVMVRARFLTPEVILDAMESGDFYASSGVTLKDVRYSAESKTLDVEVEADPNANYTIRFVGTRKDFDPSRKPVEDADGKPLPVTQQYSDDVGKTLATVRGTKASYTLTGDELYVRAVVTSDQPPPNPSFPDQNAQAWTQPVGWQGWLAEKP